MRPPEKRHKVNQPSDPSYRLIPLTRGLNAICDTADFHLLSQWNWYAKRVEGHFYAARDANGKDIYMHRQILACAKAVDHRDQDTLNNRQSNLRESTKAQNGQNRGKQANNTSGYKGVDWNKEKRKWRAKIKAHGIHRHVGYFPSKEAAARAYDAAARSLHGDFASTNFQ